jgi:hypothetical protein
MKYRIVLIYFSYRNDSLQACHSPFLPRPMDEERNLSTMLNNNIMAYGG